MKIKYSPTRSISTADLFIATDPPIMFEVKSRLSPEWARLHRIWEEEGATDQGMACELMGQAFVSVSQDAERYPIASKEDAEGLRDAIEADNPGVGGQFVCDVVQAFSFNHYNFLARSSAVSVKLSEQLNGNGKKALQTKPS